MVGEPSSAVVLGLGQSWDMGAKGAKPWLFLFYKQGKGQRDQVTHQVYTPGKQELQ